LVDRVALAAFMKERGPQVEICAARARADEPEMAGAVTLAFEIDRTGRVLSSRVLQTQISNEVLLGCLIATANTWTLPAPVGGPARVQHSFYFSGGAGPRAAGWRKEQSAAVGQEEQYPAPPDDLGRPRKPTPPPKPGQVAMRYGYLTLIGTELGALAVAATTGDALWVVPVVGPFAARNEGLDSYKLMGGLLGALQIGSIGLITYGHIKRARYNREQKSAWQRHRMNAGVSPTRQGARISFQMSF
jgi:hypothetical protein